MTLSRNMRRLLFLSYSLFVLAGISSLTDLSIVHAADLSKFSAGNIIDNATFRNNNSMSVSQIQSFLNQKDSTCLKNYRGLSLVDANKNGYVEENTTSERYGGSTGKATMSAAQIIKAASDIYDINPQVLLVTLQKEQGLITRDDCPAWRYNTALGYGCPDTAPCDQSSYGFTRQIDYGAYHLEGYYESTLNYVPYTKGVNTVYYHPGPCQTRNSQGNCTKWHGRYGNRADIAYCGSTRLNIQNEATAALYSYTPYQPNQSSLNAGYGTGNNCASYGNRNFFSYFTDWFGSTQTKTVQITRSLYFSPGQGAVSTADDVAVSFIVKNVSNTTQVLDSIGVAVRDEDNNVHNFPFKKITLEPGKSYEYYQYSNFDKPGNYRMWIANLLPDGSWSTDWPSSSKSSIVRNKSVTVTAAPDVSISRSMYYSPTSNPTNASTEDQTAASFKVLNNATKSTTIPEMRIAATHSSGSTTYYPSVKNLSLSPGQEYEYYQYTNIPKAGTHTLAIQFKTPSGKWSSTWPSTTSSSTVRERSITIVSPPNVTISRSLYVSPNPILVGQRTGASFIVRNNESTPVTIKELRVRALDSKKNVLDFPAVTNITLDPGEEYTYYQYRTFEKNDTYTFQPVAKVSTTRITSSWPRPNSNVRTKLTYGSRLPKINLIRKIYHSPSNHRPVVGQTNAVSFVIKNNEDRAITLPPLGVAVRDKNNKVVNFPFVRNVSLDAGETYEYYQYRKFNTKGPYRMWIAAGLPWGGWSSSWPYGSPSSLSRARSITVY